MSDDQTIDRKIYFYLADAGVDRKTGETIAFDAKPSLRHLEKLPNAPLPNGRYYETKAGDVLLLAPESIEVKRPTARWIKVRRHNLPEIERLGVFEAMAESDNIAERRHVVFFENQIVGMDYNHFGPGASTLAAYLSRACPDVSGLILHPIMRKDVMDELSKGGSINLIDISLERQDIDVLSDVPAFESGVAALAEAVDAKKAEIRLSIPRTRGADAVEQLKGIRSVIRKILAGARRRGGGDPDAAMKRFKIQLYDEEYGNRTVDLLTERLMTERAVQRVALKSRAVDAKSAYNAISKAYQELEDVLIDSVAAMIES